MRVWDVNPGYLNRQSLLGEHRELHGIVSIIHLKKKGYANHPETLRWVGCGWALSQRHRLLVAEMTLRGYVDRSPVLLRGNQGKWPAVFIDPPAGQLSILSTKYQGIEQGRIPLPANVQQLWAQHKYSVLARDVKEYKRIGRWVASQKSNGAMSSLCQELVLLLRQPPGAGNLRNTVQHMWGYVSRYSATPGSLVSERSTRWLLKELQRLVLLHDVVYLKESTALSELQAWR